MKEKKDSQRWVLPKGGRGMNARSVGLMFGLTMAMLLVACEPAPAPFVPTPEPPSTPRPIQDLRVYGPWFDNTVLPIVNTLLEGWDVSNGFSCWRNSPSGKPGEQAWGTFNRAELMMKEVEANDTLYPPDELTFNQWIGDDFAYHYVSNILHQLVLAVRYSQSTADNWRSNANCARGADNLDRTFEAMRADRGRYNDAMGMILLYREQIVQGYKDGFTPSAPAEELSQSQENFDYNSYDQFVEAVEVALSTPDYALLRELLYDSVYLQPIGVAGARIEEWSREDTVEHFFEGDGSHWAWVLERGLSFEVREGDVSCFGLTPVYADHTLIVENSGMNLCFGFDHVGDRYYLTDIQF